MPSWNFNDTGNHKTGVDQTNTDTAEMSEASQGRPVLPDGSNSNQISATTKQKKAKTGDTVPQKQSSDGLRKSSRLRWAPARYGQ